MQYIKYFLILAIFVHTGPILGQNNMDVFKRFTFLKNAHATEAAMQLLADSIVMDFGSLGIISGKDAARNIHEYDRALNTHLEFRLISEARDSIVCEVREKNEWLKINNIDFIIYPTAVIYFSQDHKVSRIRAKMDRSSETRLKAVINEFHAWATTNAPEKYASLFLTDGRFDYSYAGGQKVLELLGQWKQVALPSQHH